MYCSQTFKGATYLQWGYQNGSKTSFQTNSPHPSFRQQTDGLEPFLTMAPPLPPPPPPSLYLLCLCGDSALVTAGRGTIAPCNGRARDCSFHSQVRDAHRLALQNDSLCFRWLLSLLVSKDAARHGQKAPPPLGPLKPDKFTPDSRHWRDHFKTLILNFSSSSAAVLASKIS